MAIRSLTALGGRQLAHRKGRSALTGVGIALGVAILFGVTTVSRSITRSFDELIDSFNGSADVVFHAVGSYDGGLPAATAAAAAQLPDVETVSPTFGFGTVLPRPEKPREQWDEVWLGGFDRDALQRVYPVRLAGGRLFEPGAHELLLSERMAERTGSKVGTVVDLATPGGRIGFTVVGILRNDVGLPGRGRTPITSIATTQALSGRGDVLSSVDLDLRDTVDVSAWVESHREALGAGVVGERAGAAGDGFRSFLAVLTSGFTMLASIALFIAGFLIYLTFSMAVVERTKVYGTLRALGASPKQVRRVVIREAVALGVVAAPLGLALGVVIAISLLSFVGNLVGMERPQLSLSPALAVLAFVVGMGTAVVAALVPARRASRLQPIVAMRGDHARDTRLGRAWIVGAVLLPAGLVASLLATGRPTLRIATTLATLLGAVLLVPALLAPVASALGRITRRLAPGVGEVAVMHLVKERSRSAYTLALVMVVLAMIMSVASLSASMRTAMNEILDRQFAADVAVDSTSTFSTEHELAFAALDGIARTSTLRFRNAPVVRPGEPDRQSFLLTIDPASYFDVSSYAWREGDDVSAKAALSAGGAVIMTAPIAESLGIGVGDDVTLRTNEGPRPFEVAALTAGFGTGQPIVIGLADGQRYFNVGRPHTLLADIDPGADLDTVVERLERDFVPLGDFRVNPSSAIKADARSQLDGFFALFYGLLAVAGVVGLLGLANTMAVSVVQRYREVGVLRAIGTQRGQVRRMVTAETATLVLVALVLALPLGFAMSVALVQGSSNTLGYTVAFRFPVLLPVVLALLGLVATMVAAFVPGRRAARMPVVGALQFE